MIYSLFLMGSERCSLQRGGILQAEWQPIIFFPPYFYSDSFGNCSLGEGHPAPRISHINAVFPSVLQSRSPSPLCFINQHLWHRGMMVLKGDPVPACTAFSSASAPCLMQLSVVQCQVLTVQEGIPLAHRFCTSRPRRTSGSVHLSMLLCE